MDSGVPYVYYPLLTTPFGGLILGRLYNVLYKKSMSFLSATLWIFQSFRTSRIQDGIPAGEK